MEVDMQRMILSESVALKGDIKEVVEALDDLYLNYPGYDKICLEWMSYSDGTGGWTQLVGYRPMNQKELKAKEKKEKREARAAVRRIEQKIVVKKRELKILNKDLAKIVNGDK